MVNNCREKFTKSVEVEVITSNQRSLMMLINLPKFDQLKEIIYSLAIASLLVNLLSTVREACSNISLIILCFDDYPIGRVINKVNQNLF